MNMIFKCARVKEGWSSLGVQGIIDEATYMDRTGALALENVMCHRG